MPNTYFSSAPSTGGGGALTLATVTVDATVATKQDFLAAVGASTNQVPVDVIVRNASQSLAAITGGVGFSVGYNAGATDVVAGATVSTITDSEMSVKCAIADPAAVGVSGDTLGCVVDPVLYPSIVVAGAGTAAANATYPCTGTANGRPQFSFNVGDNNITWNNVDRWIIYDDATGNLYYSLDDVATPDLCTTWVADAFGSNPVPTVTEGANPTFDVDVFYYDVAI